MAKKVENEKGFLIIEMTIQEAVACLDCFGECNLCGDSVESGYYVAVIDQFYCETCYRAFIGGASRYRSDIGTERQRYIRVRRKLEDLETWEE